MVVYTLEQRFTKWVCDLLTEDANFGKKIIFSDEAHFDLGGYEKPTHPKRVTVCCGLWSRGIIEAFFFENEQ